MRVEFPYSDVNSLEIKDKNLLGIFGAPEREPGIDASTLVKEALTFPVGTPPLVELAHRRKNILIVCDDISRPTPVHKLLPAIIEQLHEAGVEDQHIELMLALGTHRFMSREEISTKLGQSVVSKYKVYNHDWKNPDTCEYMGRTAQGIEVWINKKVAQADFVIGVGRIMPIEVCGFTGGGKILIPGVCGKTTNDDMHWTRIDLPDEAVLGKPENPVRKSIDNLARQTGLDFIVNVIMDIKQRVHYVVAGDMVEAHRRGCELAMELHAVHIPEEVDIVVADSYPFDMEFWQANKALDQAGLVVRKGGVLILVAPCYEGFSAVHDEILEYGYRSIAEIKELVESGKITTKVVGVHMAQVSHVAREKAKVILVTSGISGQDVRKVGLEYADTPQDALDQAFSMLGSNTRVAVLKGAAEMLPIVGS